MNTNNSAHNYADRESRTRVFLFLSILLALTLAVHMFLPENLGAGLVGLLVMWTPGIAAILTAMLTRKHIREFGWRLSPKWMMWGWLLPVIYATVAYGLVWLFQLGGVPNPTFLSRSRITMGTDVESDLLVIVMAFFYITLYNLLPSMVLGLGEEIGWRGFLVPELSKWIGFRKACWFSGIIWGAWHLPGIVSGAYGGEVTTPLAFRIFCFTVLVVSGGVVFAWLRMRSGSIWPVVIMHATHNGVIQAFYNRITYDTGYTAYFIGEFGIVLATVLLFVAIYYYRRSDEIDNGGSDRSGMLLNNETATPSSSYNG